MALRWLEKITGSIEQKRRYWRYEKRVEQLPASYRTTVEAVNRYVMSSGSITDGESVMTMLEDLADLFERSAADQTPIHEVVGEDPLEFVEVFLQNYCEGHWNQKERQRLVDAIHRVAKQPG